MLVGARCLHCASNPLPYLVYARDRGSKCETFFGAAAGFRCHLLCAGQATEAYAGGVGISGS